MCIVVTNKKYNIVDTQIKDAREAFIKFKKMKFRENDKCFKCNKKSICRYCPGKFFLETKDYRKPADWYCLVTRKIINFINTNRLIIEKNSDELSLNNLNSMYDILIKNLQKIIPNFKENITDKETNSRGSYSIILNINYYYYFFSNSS